MGCEGLYINITLHYMTLQLLPNTCKEKSRPPQLLCSVISAHVPSLVKHHYFRLVIVQIGEKKKPEHRGCLFHSRRGWGEEWVVSGLGTYFSSSLFRQFNQFNLDQPFYYPIWTACVQIDFHNFLNIPVSRSGMPWVPAIEVKSDEPILYYPIWIACVEQTFMSFADVSGLNLLYYGSRLLNPFHYFCSSPSVSFHRDRLR